MTAKRANIARVEIYEDALPNRDADYIRIICNIEENADILAPFLTPPAEMSAHNVRTVRSLYVVDGCIIAASIHTQAGKQPYVQVQRRFSTDPQLQTQFLTGGGMSPEEVAVFLGLDSCYPRIPAWTEQKLSESNLVIVKDRLDVLGRPTG